jgi:hypothetical protein
MMGMGIMYTGQGQVAAKENGVLQAGDLVVQAGKADAFRKDSLDFAR